MTLIMVLAFEEMREAVELQRAVLDVLAGHSEAVQRAALGSLSRGLIGHERAPAGRASRHPSAFGTQRDATGATRSATAARDRTPVSQPATASANIGNSAWRKTPEHAAWTAAKLPAGHLTAMSPATREADRCRVSILKEAAFARRRATRALHDPATSSTHLTSAPAPISPARSALDIEMSPPSTATSVHNYVAAAHAAAAHAAAAPAANMDSASATSAPTAAVWDQYCAPAPGLASCSAASHSSTFHSLSALMDSALAERHSANALPKALLPRTLA
jgi:hypothetical protein